MDIGKIEYRVRPVTRYIVTRYEVSADGKNTPGVTQRGEYDNPVVAYEVAYALCKAEHERLGLPVGDERIRYPSLDDPFPNRPRHISLGEAAGVWTNTPEGVQRIA